MVKKKKLEDDGLTPEQRALAERLVKGYEKTLEALGKK